MPSETKSCQNCHITFTIEPEDFEFYEKIKVPAPTWCPECRLMRRLMVRNERNFYKRTCGLCSKSMISMYSPDKPFPVYCSECWWGDKWDASEYATEYDWNRPFFMQIHELQMKVPRPNSRCSNLVNSNYCNYVADGKNCYLCFGSIEVEDCLYGSPYESKYCVDTYLARECEFCYECIDCEKLATSSFCQDCSASFNLLYCFDCKNCQDCIGCAGLRNKSYCIYNKQYGKEDYQKEKERIFNSGRKVFNDIAEKFLATKITVPHRFATNLQCINAEGDHIVHSKNARNCFDVKRAEDCAYCVRMIDAKDTHDTNYCEYLELCYDYLGFWKVSRSKFSNTCGEGSDFEYADFCSGSSFLFGCVGLRSKQYCILNRQYTKEEYEEIVPKIRTQMNEMPYQGTNGRVYKYGEFFPPELSLLAYNESVAQDFFPRNKAQIEALGFIWKEPEVRNYTITREPEDTAGPIKDVPESIVNETIACAHSGTECNEICTSAFKITPAELDFYRRMSLPLPKLCPNCRHFARLKLRNPFKLWHRKCMKPGCTNEFETSYAPDRPEIVYCEACYQQEVV